MRRGGTDRALSQGQLRRVAKALPPHTGTFVFCSRDLSRHCLNISTFPIGRQKGKNLVSLSHTHTLLKGTIRFTGSQSLHQILLCAPGKQMHKISTFGCIIIKLHKQVDCSQSDSLMLQLRVGCTPPSPIPSPTIPSLTINKLASLMETMVCLFSTEELEWRSYQGLWQIYQSSVISSIREGICVNKKTGAKRLFQLAKAS